MPFEFKMPDVGEVNVEGEIVKWLVKEGDMVKEDQAIVQIETDKAVVDMPSPRTGKILKINFKAGETVKVGQTLVVIGNEGEKVSLAKINDEIDSKIKEKGKDKLKRKVENKTKNKFAGKRGQSVVGELEEADDKEKVEEKSQSMVMRGISQSAKVLAAPAVRKLAWEKGIDLMKIKGTGEQNRILMEDIEAKAKREIPQQSISVKKQYDTYGYVERMPLKGVRRAIANNMVKSLAEAAQITVMEDINVSNLWSIREKEKIFLQKKNVKLTLLPFIIKAVIAALKENPMFNASLEKEEIIIKKYFNIGIAVETEVGLMVPVVKNAEHKSIVSLAKEIAELADRARERKLGLPDLQGGTFTITNYGSVGGTYATPIINTGEAAILGLGKIFDRVISDRDAFRTIKVLPVSFTFDHRIADGAQASRFLEKLKIFIEDPEHLMLELD